MNNPPRTIAVLDKEGGDWHTFRPHLSNLKQVHAIKFENGWIWDTVNGWRYREPIDP